MNPEDDREKTYTEDPCLDCDRIKDRNLFIEQNNGLNTAPNEPQNASLSDETVNRYLQNEQKYKHLIEFAPDAIFIADAESGIILNTNKSAAELLGIPAEQIVGMHQSLLHPEKEAEKYKEIFQEHVGKGTGTIAEDIYVQHKSGRKIPVQINASVTQIGNKKVIYGIFRDITKQKQVFEELQVVHEQYRRLAEATFEGIVTHDKGIFVESNRQFAEMFGYSLDEIKGLNGLDLFTPESRETARKMIASENEGPYEETCLRKDGSTFPAEIRARAIHLKGKKLRIAAIRDLTEQKRLQQQFTDSKKRYSELYKNAQVPLFRSSISDGQILACSRATAKMFGYADEKDYLNHPVTMFYMNPQDRLRMLEALRKNKRIKDFEVQMKRKDGTPFWVAFWAEIFPELDYMEGVMYDITPGKLLSKTELKIIQVIMQGKSNNEIAKMLKRSVRTIEDHRSHIMKKLGAKNLIELTQIVSSFEFNPEKS